MSVSSTHSTDLTSSVIPSTAADGTSYGNTTSGAISFSGLGSGTDFSSMINQLVGVEEMRVTSLQTWQQTWATKQSAFKVMNTQLLSLRTTLQGMDTLGSFLQKSVTSSNTSAVTGTAGTGADDTAHNIQVAQLAKNKVMVTSNGYSSTTANINATGASKIFAYDYKGVLTSVSIPPGSTLTDLTNLINTSQSFGSNAGVKAALLYDGTSYYLQLRAMDTGSAATLTVDATTTLAGFSNSRFQIAQNSQNALLKLDGWPIGVGAYLSRQSNTVSDLIQGITLSFLAPVSNVSLVAQNDNAAITQNINTFVSQFNQVLSTYQSLTKVDTTNGQASLLTGNYGLDIIQSDLLDAVTGAAPGFDPSKDLYTSLSQFGISIDATQGSTTEGLLLVSNTTLQNVLTNNADALGNVFASSFIGGTNSGNFSYQSYINGLTQPGIYPVNYTVAGGKITSASINGHAAMIDSSTNMITGSAGQSESGLSIQVTNLTDGSYSGKAYLKQGIAGALNTVLGTLTDATNGPLAVLEQNYTLIQNDIQDQINAEQTRITQYAANMKAKFAKLDALLGTYSQQETALSNQVTKLNSG
ncbi:MAG: flagellar filament capping protein FliD [Desulfovibrionaceae bacterium]|nr:flagellar filament capping protein FliD [Desulfovibrionaceae bacterium]MBF0514633.1 flagellar filament capping protein FliD [Desulfovibrionaceae bacterium]